MDPNLPKVKVFLALNPDKFFLKSSIVPPLAIDSYGSSIGKASRIEVPLGGAIELTWVLFPVTAKKVGKI